MQEVCKKDPARVLLADLLHAAEPAANDCAESLELGHIRTVPRLVDVIMFCTQDTADCTCTTCQH